MLSFPDINHLYEANRHFVDDFNYKNQNRYFKLEKVPDRSIIHVPSDKKNPHSRKSYIHEVERISKQIPGPGQYQHYEEMKDLVRRSKSMPKITTKGLPQDFISQIVKTKLDVPGVGNYQQFEPMALKAQKLKKNKIIQDNPELDNIIQKKLESDYRVNLGPGAYNNHHREVGTEIKPIRFLPVGKHKNPKQPEKFPSVYSYNPNQCIPTFEKSLMVASRSVSQTKLARSKRFAEDKHKSPGPAAHANQAEWGLDKRSKNKNIYDLLSNSQSKSIYY